MNILLRKSQDEGYGFLAAIIGLLVAAGLHISGALEVDESKCHIREVDGYSVCQPFWRD